MTKNHLGEMTIVDKVRHAIRDQCLNGARVFTWCGREIWRAPAHRDHGQDVPNCQKCYPKPPVSAPPTG